MGINGLSFQICILLQKYTVGKRLQKFWPPCKSHTEDSLGKKKRQKILCWPSKWRWVLSCMCTNESKAKWCPNFIAGANQCYVSQSLLDFYEGGDLFSLCLFLLLGKQACIKMEGGIKILCLCGPLATPCVCGTQKGKRVPQGGGIFSVLEMALNQLHITQPPCWATGSRYSCWDKFIHDCMGSCLIEPHYFNFLLTPCTLWGAAQACGRGRGWAAAASYMAAVQEER